jgi:hypothetical protein
MIVTLKTQGLQTLEQIRAFLAGSAPLSFAVPQREAAYGFVAAQLSHFGYRRLGKADKGLVHRYLCKVTGLSRAQLARLIAQHAGTGRIEDRSGSPSRPLRAPLHGRGRAAAGRSSARCMARCPDRPRVRGSETTTVARPPASRWRVALRAWRPVAWAKTADAPLGGDRGKNAICVVRRLPVLSV